MTARLERSWKERFAQLMEAGAKKRIADLRGSGAQPEEARQVRSVVASGQRENASHAAMVQAETAASISVSTKCACHQ